MSYRLPDPAGKARYVRDKFDEIARHYDLFNDLISQGQHRRWKNILVRRLGLRAGARMLDLCCGTGDIAVRVRRRMGQGGALVLLDFSPEMLRIARRRMRAGEEKIGLEGKSLTAPALLQGDAMGLPFRDRTLDFVTVGYGLRNVTGLRECLLEIHRVLKPGGVVGSLDVGKVRTRWIRPLVDFYFFRIVPWIGRLLQPGQEMFTYLPHSSLEYPGQDALRELLLDVGFEEVEMVEFVFGASVIHFARKAPATSQ